MAKASKLASDLGLALANVYSDGNCLFCAVAVAIGQNQGQHAAIRRLAVKAAAELDVSVLQANASENAPKLRSVDESLSRMLNPVPSGNGDFIALEGETEIQAFAKASRIKMIVHDVRSANEYLRTERGDPEAKQTFHIARLSNNHYAAFLLPTSADRSS